MCSDELTVHLKCYYVIEPCDAHIVIFIKVSRCFTDVCHWIFCCNFFLIFILCFIVVSNPFDVGYIVYCFRGIVDEF